MIHINNGPTGAMKHSPERELWAFALPNPKTEPAVTPPFQSTPSLPPLRFLSTSVVKKNLRISSVNNQPKDSL